GVRARACLCVYVSPHSTTFFPYTTLFRSSRHLFVLFLSLFSLSQFRLRDDRGEHVVLLVRFLLHARPRVRFGRIGFATETAQEEDRKSTRLNSSHVKISYAVFCLKNKT